MEEEDEQEDQDQEEVEQQLLSPSDLGGVPWKEAVELHAKLRGDEEDEGEALLADAVSRDGEVDEDDEEDEEEYEEEDDEESSDGKLVFRSRCDFSEVPVKSGNVVCLLWCMLTSCLVSI